MHSTKILFNNQIEFIYYYKPLDYGYQTQSMKNESFSEHKLCQLFKILYD